MLATLIRGSLLSILVMGVSYAEEWGYVATISETVNNRVCVYNIDGDSADEIDCAAEAPYVDTSGNVSVTGVVSAPILKLEGAAGGNGVSQTVTGGGSADNLGDHTATTALNMDSNPINDVEFLQIVGSSTCSGASDYGKLIYNSETKALYVCKD